MKLLNNTIEISNKKVKEQMLLDFSIITYDTWLKYIENAFLENNNIIIKVDTEFVKNIIEDRYIEYIEKCYKLFINFKNIEISIHKNIEKELNTTSYEYDTLKIKTASEMKEFTNSIINRIVEMDKVVQVELDNILNQIEIMAKTGCFSVTINLYPKQVNKEVVEKIIDILKENGYTVNLKTLLDKKEMLEINWDL